MGPQQHSRQAAGRRRQHAGTTRFCGPGLVWDSPLGMLRTDYAIPLVKQPYDKTQNFSFGLMPF